MFGSIASWLLAKGLAKSLPAAQRMAKGALIAVLILLAVGGAVWWINASETKDDQVNQSIGASGAVIAGQTQTLEQLGDANDAEQDLRSGGERSAARYAECLRNARTKARCERYNPDAGAE